MLADGLHVNLKMGSLESCEITYVFTTLFIHLRTWSCKHFPDLRSVRVHRLCSRPTYVFLGIARILQCLYTPSSLIYGPPGEILISEDLDGKFLFSLQEGRRVFRHSKLLMDAGPEICAAGPATAFAQQAGASRARWR